MNGLKGIILFTLLISACSQQNKTESQKVHLIDQNATKETKALYNNLKNISNTSVLFGHQDDLAYGYNWWGEDGRSDVKEASGSYPAVYGWDIGNIVEKQENLDGINFENMRKWINEGHLRGGIITISWHMINPVTKGNSWDTVPTIAGIFEDEETLKEFTGWLDIFADFSKSLKGEEGALIPVIFRPFHEHNGDWFWWGKGLNSEEDYIKLWRYTVEYLRDEKEVNNLIWAFSPDRSRIDIANFKAEYFYGYPGDEYVDIIGLDNYWDVGHPANELSPDIQQEQFVRSLTYTAQLADSLNKVAALTETGTEKLPASSIWSDRYFSALNANEWTRKMAYMLVWRNANRERENRDHFYASYEGHPTQSDFVRFKEQELILFEDELPNMYSLNK